MIVIYDYKTTEEKEIKQLMIVIYDLYVLWTWETKLLYDFPIRLELSDGMRKMMSYDEPFDDVLAGLTSLYWLLIGR